MDDGRIYALGGVFALAAARIVRGSRAKGLTGLVAAELPTVMYHGRTVDSTAFDLGRVGGEAANDQDGPGFYFTDDPEDAWSYAYPHGVLLRARLVPRKLVPHTGRPKQAEIARILRGSPCLSDVLMDWDEHPARAFQQLLSSVMRNETPFSAFQSAWYDAYHRCGEDAAYLRNMAALGYDGAVSPTDWRGRLHVVMFDPTRIVDVEVVRRR